MTKPQVDSFKRKSVARKLEASEAAERFSVTSPTKPANELKKPNGSISMAAQQAEAQVTTPIAAAPQAMKSRPTLPSTESNVAPPLRLRQDLIAPNAAFSAVGRAARLQTLARAPRTDGKTLWTLDGTATDGTIQKSDDGGRTWRTIHIDGTTWFYALSAKGSEVWVGGADGKLFHTVDSGGHWAEVSISNERARLAGSITEIQVPAEGMIKLKTNSGETWVTDDGGVHWRAE